MVWCRSFLFIGALFASWMVMAKGPSAAQRARYARQYKIHSQSVFFRDRLASGIHFYENIRLRDRPESVHPRAPYWFKSVTRRWINTTGHTVLYHTDPEASEVADFCGPHAAAFVWQEKIVVYCPTGISDAMSMMGTLLHEMRHVALIGRPAMGHVACLRGPGLGSPYCDDFVFANPMSVANGAFAQSIFYYHTLYHMGLGLSAYEKRIAKSRGQFFLNNYVNHPKANRSFEKHNGVWRFR